MKNLSVVFPLLVVVATLLMGCAMLDADGNEPPHGMRRMIRTLESADIARSEGGMRASCRVAHGCGLAQSINVYLLSGQERA